MRGIVFILASMWAFGAEPDAQEIINRSLGALDADWKAKANYSYLETDQDTQLDSLGNVKSRTVNTYHVMMIEGTPYDRLVAADHRQLTPEEERKEEQKMQRATAKRRNESREERARRIAAYQKERRENQAMMTEMARAFQFRLVGEQNVDGRQAYLLDATPRPDYQPPNTKAKALTGMRGKLWVDKKEYQWIKVQAEVVQPVSFHYFLGRLNPGTQIEYELMPVEGGVWQPKYLRIRVNAKILMVKSRNTLEEETYSQYRRIDSADAQVRTSRNQTSENQSNENQPASASRP